jgi:hypothetical protein
VHALPRRHGHQPQQVPFHTRRARHPPTRVTGTLHRAVAGLVQLFRANVTRRSSRHNFYVLFDLERKKNWGVREERGK